LLFLIVAVGFIGIGYWAYILHEISSFSDFIIFALERSPIIAGLILLEEFSRRQFRATERLMEDYAFKESISIAFDGYKNAMKELDASATESLANLLSQNVIATLNERPGRLIDEPDTRNNSADDFLKVIGAADGNNTAIVAATGLVGAIQRNLKSSGVKLAFAIVFALIIGVGAGYYLNVSNVDLSVVPVVDVQSNASIDSAP
jgi:hypothetical protein